MSRRQGKKAEETRRNILAAAEELFMTRGYDAVTMREIAKQAGCSHTAIYIYFREKETLLLELSLPLLRALRKQVNAIMEQEEPPHEQLITLCLSIIRFGLTYRNMYPFIFTVKSLSVDDENQSVQEINDIRVQLFSKFEQAIQSSLELEEHDNRLLTNVDILSCTLHGIIVTYSVPKEGADEQINKLTPLFQEACEVLLAGFRWRISQT